VVLITVKGILGAALVMTMARLIMAMAPMEVITGAIMEATTDPQEEEMEVVEAVATQRAPVAVIPGREIVIII